MTQIDGINFEYYIQRFFEDRGCTIFETPQTNDFGADLVLYYRGRVIVIQCKYWSAPVGVKAVQEIAGAIPYYHANFGIVITNQTFTAQARKLAVANQVILIDGDALWSMLNDVSGDVRFLDEFLEETEMEHGTAANPVAPATLFACKPRQTLILRPLSPAKHPRRYNHKEAYR